jgi:hypothetical protein
MLSFLSRLWKLWSLILEYSFHSLLLANSHNFSRSQLRCNLFWFITPHQVRAGCSPLSTHLAHILKWPSYWYVFSHRPRTF